jgi:cytochrome P450
MGSDAYFRQDSPPSPDGSLAHVRLCSHRDRLRPDDGGGPVRALLPDAPMGLVESYRAARRNLLEIIPRSALHQPVMSGRTGPQRWHMLMEPPAIRRVMLEAVEDYPKSVATRAVLQPAIGDSLFLAEGDHWRWQRRATAPAFSARSIDALTPVMTRAAEAAAERLEPSVGRAANMVEHMTAATFDVIADVTFADGEGVNREGVVAALETYIDDAARMSILDVLGVPCKRSAARTRHRRAAIAPDACRDGRRHRAPRPPAAPVRCPTFWTGCWRPRMAKPGAGWMRRRCVRTC